MRPHYSLALLVVLSGSGLASCASSPPTRKGPSGPLPVANADAARAAGLSTLQTDVALKLYTAKCIRCHKSYDPHAYTDVQWQTWMSKMSRKAHLDSQQKDLLARYLQAVRATTTPDKPE
jgi:hypothetical protein